MSVRRAYSVESKRTDSNAYSAKSFFVEIIVLCVLSDVVVSNNDPMSTFAFKCS